MGIGILLPSATGRHWRVLAGKIHALKHKEWPAGKHVYQQNGPNFNIF